MNPHQLFSPHHWWGKLIGAGLGYLIMGAAGAVVGILIGNLFDQGLTEHLRRPHWQYAAEKRKHVQIAFFESTFSVMGHIAKADGRITEAQISMVRQLLNDMRLSKKQRTLAKAYFIAGKNPEFDLWRVLSLLREVTSDNPELLKLFIDLQFQVALVGGLSLNKQQKLNAILTFMGFLPLHDQHRFYEDFSRQNTSDKYRQNNTHSSENSRQYQNTEIDHAYGVLGINRNASKQEVKRAYRLLISRNHPDKLIAKGLPEGMIKIANEKTQQIRKAYEQICAERKW
jgi:DnaJ like chaperone protein